MPPEYIANGNYTNGANYAADNADNADNTDNADNDDDAQDASIANIANVANTDVWTVDNGAEGMRFLQQSVDDEANSIRAKEGKMQGMADLLAVFKNNAPAFDDRDITRVQTIIYTLEEEIKNDKVRFTAKITAIEGLQETIATRQRNLLAKRQVLDSHSDFVTSDTELCQYFVASQIEQEGEIAAEIEKLRQILESHSVAFG